METVIPQCNLLMALSLGWWKQMDLSNQRGMSIQDKSFVYL